MAKRKAEVVPIPRIRWTDDEIQKLIDGAVAADCQSSSRELLRIIRQVQVEVLPIHRRRPLHVRGNLTDGFMSRLDEAYRFKVHAMIERARAIEQQQQAEPSPPAEPPPEQAPQVVAVEPAPVAVEATPAAPPPNPPPAPESAPQAPPLPQASPATGTSTGPSVAALVLASFFDRFLVSFESLAASAELAVELYARSVDRPQRVEHHHHDGPGFDPAPGIAPPAVPLQKVVIVGGNNDQHRNIQRAHGANFRLVTFGEFSTRVKDHIRNADVVIGMCRFLSHPARDFIKAHSRNFVPVEGSSTEVCNTLDRYLPGAKPRSNGNGASVQ